MWKIINTAVPLNINTWKDGEIISYSQKDCYSINVTAGQTYYFWCNDYYEGDDTKTAGTYIQGYYSDGSYAFSVWQAWNNPEPFYADQNDTIYISVSQNGSSGGTYAIAYSTDNNRPTP